MSLRPSGRRPDVRVHRRFPWALAWLALVLALLAGLRAWLVDASLADSAACSHCLVLPTLGHDAALLAPAWALLALAAAVHRASSRVLLALPVLVLLLAMTADVAILTTLGLRLYLFDVFKFGTEGAALGGFVAALLRSSGAGWLVAALLALFACLGVLWPGRSAPRLAAALGTAAVFAGIGAIATQVADPDYVIGESMFNLVELHRAQTVNTPYSADFVRGIAQRDAPWPRSCEAGQARRPDVLLIAVESLSSYQSKLLGGSFDDTPRLDAFAQRHTWFRSFHANGFTTDHGLIALLTGEAPIPAIGRYRSLEAFAGYGDRERSVVAPLHAAGYEVAFFTTGDLGFLDKAPWLRGLGFDHWEGAEAQFYAGWPRYAFSAAEDRALYLRLEQWMAQRDRTRPFFAFALTVQSHPPFVDLATQRLDERAVMRVVDAALADFIDRLEASGYFERGILIVTGDHRSMTPLHPAERAAFGARAFSRIPFIVAGASGLAPGPIDAPFQQTDLLPSLRDLTAAEACHGPDEGRFLRADPRPPAWVLHARGDLRNRIDVYVGAEDGALLLDGDDSRWIGARPPQSDALADRIHRDRIRRGALDADVEALLRIMGR
jgi:lipoteichoic acid synthase